MACPAGQIAFAFDAVNPEALAWIEDRAGALITEVDATTRAAVRDLVYQSFDEGIPPRTLAVLIRDVVGLTTRDVLAVMRSQLEDLAAGVDAALAASRATAYAGELLRARALTIARTETMAAANAGQQMLWEQAVGEGLLSRSMMKEWIVADDERLCDECAPLAGETVPVEETFSVGQDPPLHPNCRCTMGLVGGPA